MAHFVIYYLRYIIITFLKTNNMIRFSMILLIAAIAAGVYAIAAPGVFANVLAFGTIVVLYLSLLGSKRTA